MWLLLQLADAAFPAGGFAHSGGLEAAVQLGEVAGGEGVARFAAQAAWQAGLAGLPFVGAAHAAPERVAEIDGACDAFLTGHVVNRASRTQGRAFVATCARVFDDPAIAALDLAARERLVPAHLAPAFGAVTRALGASRREAQALHLHLSLRGVLSAAVRLGVVGPHEAQRVQRAQAPLLDRILDACGALAVEDAAQPAPLLELVANAQDTLYSRLFQS